MSSILSKVPNPPEAPDGSGWRAWNVIERSERQSNGLVCWVEGHGVTIDGGMAEYHLINNGVIGVEWKQETWVSLKARGIEL